MSDYLYLLLIIMVTYKTNNTPTTTTPRRSAEPPVPAVPRRCFFCGFTLGLFFIIIIEEASIILIHAISPTCVLLWIGGVGDPSTSLILAVNVFTTLLLISFLYDQEVLASKRPLWSLLVKLILLYSSRQALIHYHLLPDIPTYWFSHELITFSKADYLQSYYIASVGVLLEFRIALMKWGFILFLGVGVIRWFNDIAPDDDYYY